MKLSAYPKLAWSLADSQGAAIFVLFFSFSRIPGQQAAGGAGVQTLVFLIQNPRRPPLLKAFSQLPLRKKKTWSPPSQGLSRLSGLIFLSKKPGDVLEQPLFRARALSLPHASSLSPPGKYKHSFRRGWNSEGQPTLPLSQ